MNWTRMWAVALAAVLGVLAAPNRSALAGFAVCCDNTTFACTAYMGGCPAGSSFVFGSCTPDLCMPGACCDSAVPGCQLLPPGLCNSYFFGGSSTCSPNLCTFGACCDKGCFLTLVGNCSGPIRGATCSPDPCSAPAPCSCTWVNGDYDNRDGQISHLGGAFPSGAKAADDFYLCEGFVYDLNVINATILTTTTIGLVKPRAEIWSDCNGCPGTLLYTLDGAFVNERGTDAGPAFDGRLLRIVDVTWSIDNSQPVVANRNIVLKGGTYWLSVYGVTDNLSLMNPPMYDVTYWGTTGGGIRGLPAKKIDGIPTPVYNQFNFGTGCGTPTGWKSVTDGCCIGCTDLNFSVCANPCKILIDNGGARRQVAGSIVGSTSQFAATSNSPLETRTADDFVVPPCQDYTVCYVEGCVLTNCPTFEGVFEIYNNDCHKPSYTLHGSSRNGPFVATKIIPLGFQATLGGKLVTAYKLEFHDLSFQLTGGAHYWISMGVRYTFSINERAFFCYNDDCARSCLVRWNPARVLTAFSQDLDFVNIDQRLGWAALADDCSFLLAADGNSLPGPINSTPNCAADYNRDGILNVLDIFDYLSSWFRGCP